MHGRAALFERGAPLDITHGSQRPACDRLASLRACLGVCDSRVFQSTSSRLPGPTSKACRSQGLCQSARVSDCICLYSTRPRAQQCGLHLHPKSSLLRAAVCLLAEQARRRTGGFQGSAVREPRVRVVARASVVNHTSPFRHAGSATNCFGIVSMQRRSASIELIARRPASQTLLPSPPS